MAGGGVVTSWWFDIARERWVLRESLGGAFISGAQRPTRKRKLEERWGYRRFYGPDREHNASRDREARRVR